MDWPLSAQEMECDKASISLQLLENTELFVVVGYLKKKKKTSIPKHHSRMMKFKQHKGKEHPSLWTSSVKGASLLESQLCWHPGAWLTYLVFERRYLPIAIGTTSCTHVGSVRLRSRTKGNLQLANKFTVCSLITGLHFSCPLPCTQSWTCSTHGWEVNCWQPCLKGLSNEAPL